MRTPKNICLVPVSKCLFLKKCLVSLLVLGFRAGLVGLLIFWYFIYMHIFFLWIYQALKNLIITKLTPAVDIVLRSHRLQFVTSSSLRGYGFYLSFIYFCSKCSYHATFLFCFICLSLFAPNIEVFDFFSSKELGIYFFIFYLSFILFCFKWDLDPLNYSFHLSLWV